MDECLAQAKQALTGLKSSLTKTDTKIEQLLERIVDADNPTVIRAYEAKLAKLEKDKLLTAEKSLTQANLVTALMKCSNSPCDSSQTPGIFGLLAI